MALDLFTLLGTVKVETNSAERKLTAIDGAARKSKQGLDDAGNSAEKAGKKLRGAGDDADAAGAKFNKASGQIRDASGKFVAAGESAAGSVRKQQSAVEGMLSSLDSLAGQITRVGVGLTASITVPLAGAVAAIVGTGSQTETALNRMEGASHATAEQMDKVRIKARELGRDLTLPNTSAKDASLAMLELNKGGLSVEQSMDAARGTIQLAKAALIGEKQAAEITADALNTFNLSGGQATRVADLLAGAASNSSGEVTDMAAALAQAGAVARGAGVSIEDTVTAISLLAKNGIKGSDAGTSLKTFLLALQTPVSDGAAKALKRLDLNAYDAQRRMKPLPQLLGEFRAKLDTLDDPSKAGLLKEVFGADAVRAARILFGEGTAGFEKMRQAVTRSGQAQEQAAAATKGLAGAWGGLTSVVETVGGDIYDDLKGPLTELVVFVTGVVSRVGDVWNTLSPGAKVFVATLLSAAAAVGPLLVVLGGLLSMVVGVAGSIATFVGVAGGAAAAVAGLGVAALAVVGLVINMGIAFAGLVAVVTAFVSAYRTDFAGLRTITETVISGVTSVVTAGLGAIRQAWAQIYPQLAQITSQALGAVQAFWERHGETVVAVVKAAFGVVKTVVVTGINVVSQVVQTVLAVMSGRWDQVWVHVVRGVAAAWSTIASLFAQGWQTTLSLLLSMLKGISDLADRFQAAAAALALRFIKALDDEIRAGAPRVIAAVLSVAAMMSDPGVLAAYAAAGAAKAEAHNRALEFGVKGFAPQGAFGGPGDEYVYAGDVGRNASATPPKPTPGPLDKLRSMNFGGGGGGRRGGGGGGGRSGPDLNAMRASLSDLEDSRHVAGLSLDLTKFRAGLELEQSLLDSSLKAQTVSVEQYWKRREAVTLQGLDAEINHIRAKQELANEAYRRLYAGVTGDKKLGGQERTLKLQELSAKWAEKNYQFEEQAAEATARRRQAAAEIPALYADAARQLEKTMSGLRADFLDSQFDPVEATRLRADEKFRELSELARVNRQLYPDAEKWVEALKRAEVLTSNIARLAERVELGKGGLTLETAQIQDKITDGVLGEREGRRQIYELELKYRDVLLGVLNEELTLAKIRGDQKTIQAIRQQIHETERLGRVINQTRAEARGIFEGAFSRGLDDLNKGLKQAAVSFGMELLEGIRRAANERILEEASKVLFGKNDEYGSDPGLIGKALERIGLGGLLGEGKGAKKGDTSAQVSATVEKTARETQTTFTTQLDTTSFEVTSDADWNADRIIAAIRESKETLHRDLEALRPAQQGFWKGLLGAGLSGAVSGLTSGLVGRIFGDGEGGGRESTHGYEVDEDTGEYTRPRVVGRAFGGPITGPGSSTSDSIIAALSDGEYVIKAASVQRLGLHALDFINRTGRLPAPAIHRAGGGLASPYAPPVRAYGSARPGSSRREAPQVHVSVSVRPDAQGRVRSASQIQVEMWQAGSETARRDG